MLPLLGECTSLHPIPYHFALTLWNDFAYNTERVCCPQTNNSAEKMKIKPVLLAAATALLLSDCTEEQGPPKYDTTSNQTILETSVAVRNSIPGSQQAEYDEALKVVVLENANLEDMFQVTGESVSHPVLIKRVHGMTGQEIIEEAKRIKLQKARAILLAKAALYNQLQQKQVDAELAAEQLANFRILATEYIPSTDDLLSHSAVAISVANNLEQAVSRVYFEVTISSKDREAPWISDTIQYKIPGGLEPGEKADWRLNVPFHGDGKAPADADIYLVVTQVDDAAGEAIHSTTHFTANDKATLAELQQTLLVK
jgi:hypothetical protein